MDHNLEGAGVDALYRPVTLFMYSCVRFTPPSCLLTAEAICFRRFPHSNDTERRMVQMTRIRVKQSLHRAHCLRWLLLRTNGNFSRLTCPVLGAGLHFIDQGRSRVRIHSPHSRALSRFSDVLILLSQAQYPILQAI